MKPQCTLALLTAAPLLAGCIIIDDDGTSREFSSSYSVADERLGSVFGASVEADAVTFLVRSSGCTDETYFDVDVDRVSSGSYAVSIDRIRVDTCEANLPGGVAVTYTFDELNIPDGSSVSVRNPVRRR